MRFPLLLAPCVAVALAASPFSRAAELPLHPVPGVVSPEGEGPPGAPVAVEIGPGLPADPDPAAPAQRSPVVLRLVEPAGRLSPGDPGFESWIEWIADVVTRHAGSIAAVQLGSVPVGSLPAASEALALKRASLAVRSAARAAGREIAVVQPPLAPGNLAVQEALWAEDLAAYVDVIPLVYERGDRPALEAFARATLAHAPAPTIWAECGAFPGAAVEALAAGARVAFVRGHDRWVAGAAALLAEGFEPAPTGAMRVDGGTLLGRFFRIEGFETVAFYEPEAAEPAWELAGADLVLEDGPLREVRLLDLAEGRVRPAPSRRTAEGRRAISVVAGRGPFAVRFGRGPLGAGGELPPQEVEVGRTRTPTAEEIIARYQARQGDEDRRLERWTALGRVDFHFGLGNGGGTVDVAIDSRYFWERGGALEWEQRDYYINGNKVSWKSFPRLPLIQPEKVVTLPLDLTLDKTYTYRLRGEERVDGRPTWVLEFGPTDPTPGAPLYRGRIFIDQETWERRKVALVQSGLAPPVISNEEIDRYRTVRGPRGGDYSMFSRIDGQQVWNLAGRSFVVQRELVFREIEINPPREAFERARDEAYASRNQMLRDTDRGFRYLDRTKDGERVVQENVATRQLLAGVGAFDNASQDRALVVPALNYFDFDLFGRGIQTNVFFAGVFANATLSKPDYFGGRMDLTVDTSLSAVGFDDKLFVGDVESREERLEIRPQRVALRAGFPLGEFVKLNLIGALEARAYELDEEAREEIAELGGGLSYVLPEDHLSWTGTLQARFNRRGYRASVEGSVSARSEWEAFGLYDAATMQFGRIDPAGMFVAGPPEPVEDRYTRFRASLFKEWFLPKFQKTRGEVSWLDGRDLDRFSRYNFSFLGDDRLHGFSGSGVRFDRGAIVRAGYSFNLFGAIRFDLGVDTARVEDESTGDGSRSFTGAGLSGNFPGPWKTVFNLSYGRALASDIPELEGQDEFLFLVLKLF